MLSTRHISEGKERVAKQRKMVEELSTAGKDATLAVNLLLSMEQTLTSMKEHHAILLSEKTTGNE